MFTRIALVTFSLVAFQSIAFAADVFDRDGDGMSDVWQRVHNIATGDTASDPDNDGHDNAQEARAGTNPHNIASRLHAITFTLNTTATTATLTWKSEDQKKYDIEVSSDLTTWTHHSYTDGNGNIKTSTITLAAAAQKFYRIRARQTEDDGDFDTLTDWEETLLGTNRALADTDGDGMHDDWEFIQLFNPLANEAFADADGDGVPNVGEFLFGFNPHSATTTPGVLDFNVFPWAGDADNDGLTNQQELLVTFTHAKNDDTDSDGLGDGWEVENNLNPNNATGIDGANGDPDAEGLSNIEEFGNKTKARLPDSDGDNVSDKVEVDQGSDPNDPNDKNPPPAGSVPVIVSFGDGSSSHSEKYKIILTPVEGPDTQIRDRTNTKCGIVEARTIRLLKNCKYELTMTHVDTDDNYRGLPNPDLDYTLNVNGPCILVEDPYAEAPTSHPMLGTHDNDEPPHTDGSFWAGGKTAYVYVPGFTWVTPKNSPVTAPSDTLPGQNEFTFSTASPGVLSLEFEVEVKPTGIAQKLVDKELVKFAEPTSTITGSTFAWETANADGKPTASGDKLKANAKYTTLPMTNDQFGLKKAKFACDGMGIPDADFEVFFPRNAHNHPSDANNANWPNWMFYWLQTVTPLGNPAPTFVFGGSTFFTPSTTQITMSNGDAGEYDAPYATNNTLTGIDNFAWTIAHESQHYKDWVDLWGNDYANWFNNRRFLSGPNDDLDADQIPNSVEDANGNGIYDAGDLSDWMVLNTPGHDAAIINDFEEWDCQRHKTVKGDHSKDWGKPGMQHKTLDRYDD